MSNEDSEQHSLGDFSKRNEGGSPPESTPEQSDPSPDDPAEFLSFLQQNSTSATEAVEALPVLVDHVRRGGYGAWTAGQCIDIILEAASPPVDCPELLSVLGDDHVEPQPLIDHLLALYPRDNATLTIPIDLKAIDDLPVEERIEAYRVLSRVPPDESVYKKLRETAEVFADISGFGEEYPVDGFFATYAMRCLRTYLRYPEEAPLKCAELAVRDHPWKATRVIAADPGRAIRVGLIKHLRTSLEDRPFPSGVSHGRLIATLCEFYMETESSEAQDQIAALVEVLLNNGVHPTQWESTVPQLLDVMIAGEPPRRAGSVLAALFDAVRKEAIGGELIARVVEQLTADEPDLWTDSVAVFVEAWPTYMRDQVGRLVEVARKSQGPTRTSLCEAIATLGKIEPEAVFTAINPLVKDLERVSSAREVEDVGEILQSLKVYPPPPQLESLYGSTNEAIDKTAKEIVRELRRQFRTSQPPIVPGEVEDLQSLSQEYCLLRHSGGVWWESPDLTTAELSIVQMIAHRVLTTSDHDIVDNGRAKKPPAIVDGVEAADQDVADDVQIVVPSYDPRWFEFVLLGVVFAQIISPETRVVVHSPATNGWGTKKEIKDALARYAIAPTESQPMVVPLLDLVPTARITEGELKVESKSTTVSDTPPYLTLVRDVDPLAAATADVVLYNFLPGIDATNAAQLREWRGAEAGKQALGEAQGSASKTVSDGYGEVADQATLTNLIQIGDVNPEDVESTHRDDPTHVEFYSLFTAHQAADRRQHVGPPTDLFAPSLISDEGTQDHTSEEQDTSRVTTGPSVVDLHAVQSDDEVGELLSKIDDYSESVDDPDAARALRRFRYTIGSLPVPVELHDAWVQDQLDHGNRWVPQQLHRRRDRIDDLAAESGFDARILDDSLVTVDGVLDRLAESNPLFEELMAVLDSAAADEKRVGILCAKKTYKDMLDLALSEHASDWALGEDLQLLDDDTVRELSADEIDWLISFGPLPPQTAIYYHHPAVEKTIVIGHADGTLESRVHGVDYKRRPYFPERLETKMPELDVTIHGTTRETADEEQSLTDDLYRTFLSVAAQSRSDDGSGSGSSSEIARYQLEFEEAPTATLWDSHPVIIRSDEHLVSTGEYVLRSLGRIGAGDEIVLVDSDIRSDLWEEFLRQDWSESDDAVDAEEAFMDAVELWYDAVSNGLAAHSDTSDPGDGIWKFARELESDVPVATETIVDWARSVYRAESPSDLVFRSELRIGPRQSDGVEEVAKAYGSDRMANNWEQVYARIKAIRATHRKRGSVFWEWLADLACSGDLFDYPGVSQATVTRCQEIDRD